MSDRNQKKVTVLIGAAMGLVMGIYWKTLQAVRREIIPKKDNQKDE